MRPSERFVIGGIWAAAVAAATVVAIGLLYGLVTIPYL